MRIKYKAVCSFMVIALLLSGCSNITSDGSGDTPPESSSIIEQEKVQIEQDNQDNMAKESTSEDNEKTTIEIRTGDTVITAMLDNSETTKAFLETLPRTITMTEYGGREYYGAIEALPQTGEAIETFENGDVTYFTAGSFAIFYAGAESSTQGGLIRMGKITSDLSVFKALGNTAEMQISVADTQGAQSVEEEVLAALRRQCDAMVNKDIDVLDEMIPEDAVIRHITGATQTKWEWLGQIEDEQMRYFNIDIENPVVTVNGDTATVSYTSVIHARIYGSEGTWRLNGNPTFEKVDGVWVWARNN